MLQRGHSSQGASALVSVHPPGSFVYRVARGPDPFEPFDDGGHPSNRFDDPGVFTDPVNRRGVIPPDQRFLVLYCATQRACAFGETIARFRPSIETLSRLEAISDEDRLDPTLLSNTIPADWRFKRRIGWIQLDPSLSFVDINHASTISRVRTSLAPLLGALGLTELDLSAVTSQHRRLTQEIARFVYEQVDSSGEPLYAGIRYTSRLHDQWECWAIFNDRLRHTGQHVGSIFPDDPGLIEAAQVLGLELPEPF